MGALGFSHGGNIYEIKRKYHREVIDFSANINPLALPSAVKEELRKNFKAISSYPDLNGTDLVRVISKRWKIKEENILLGNGSVEFIYLIINYLKPDRVIIPCPSFSEYERAARINKSRCDFIWLKEKENFKFYGADSPKADICFLSNPSNPTGNLLFDKSMKKFPAQVTVIDEAFMDFLPGEENYSFIHNALTDRRLLVLRSFTKFFALPGLRIGFLAAHKDIIAKLKHRQVPWNTNVMAQLSARLLLENKDYIKKTHVLIAKEREFLAVKIKEITGLKAFDSVTNFILVKIEKAGPTSDRLERKFLERGILIRNCSNFRGLGSDYFRLAVRNHQDNVYFIDKLREIFKEG